MMSKTRGIWSYLVSASKNLNKRTDWMIRRDYAGPEGCRQALGDIPKEPVCEKDCERRKKKKDKGILHKIKLKVLEGGSNFGTPFRRLECKNQSVSGNTSGEPEEKPIALPAPPPKKPVPPMPAPWPAVQVSILGADTAIGQYVALLLKQCSCIKKLRLYEAKDNHGCNRDLGSVVQDLENINTSCRVQAFSCACYDLERCLQNADIVLMLESGYVNVDMPFDKRFEYQAPIVKCYADAIANECPKAFVIVCATPIDCMVPLIAETLKETGWYNPNKLLGSMAVPEMRASTLAARALCLEPRYCRVPCVGGTEGLSLVPLFSKAVDYFDFAEHNAAMMTEAVRNAPAAVSRTDGPCTRVGDLSEAHALAGLVTAVAHGLLCHDIPRVTGFVETDLGHVISPARFIASSVEVSKYGILKHVGLPKMNEVEATYLDKAITQLHKKQEMAFDWYIKYISSSGRLDTCQSEFFRPKYFDSYKDCAYTTM